MKYKLGVFAMLAVMLASAVIATAVDQETTSNRVHQHLTGRQPDAGCDCDGSELCTHLPLVVIRTNGQAIPGTNTGEMDAYGESISTLAPDGRDVVDVELAIIDHQGRNNHPTDQPTASTISEIRVRGHASRLFEKSSYRLNFVDESGEDAPIEVMGMAAHSDWVLYGPYLDKSLVRNYMWYNIAGEVMEWAPNVRYCELIIDGDYKGLYIMMETITNGDDGRLNLTDTVYGTSVTGYLLRSDRTTEADVDGERDVYTYLERTLTISTDIAVRYPKRAALTEEMRRQIELDFAEFERALYSYDYDTGAYGYQNYIDEDNFVDYFLLNEFTLNMDTGRYSTYIYKDMSSKYKLAVWDFNNACDNFSTNAVSPYQLEMENRPWFLMLCRSPRFVDKVLDRYGELRQTVLSQRYLENYIDETLAYLGPAIERNTRRWSEAVTQWEPLIPAERNAYSTQEAADQLKRWLIERGHWLDNNIHTLQQYCHESRNKNYAY